MSTTLADCDAHNSQLVVSLLHLATYFLSQYVKAWQTLPSYLSSKRKTDAINVIYDCAEREMKLSADFVDVTQSEEHFQNVLQIVEMDTK